MQIPLQVTFEGTEPLGAGLAVIEREVARLETERGDIIGCRVAVIAPSGIRERRIDEALGESFPAITPPFYVAAGESQDGATATATATEHGNQRGQARRASPAVLDRKSAPG